MNAYEIYIITAILCGLVTAGIAKMKGRSPLLWFFIGAALNVLVLTAILLYSDARKNQASGMPPRSQT